MFVKYLKGCLVLIFSVGQGVYHSSVKVRFDDAENPAKESQPRRRGSGQVDIGDDLIAESERCNTDYGYNDVEINYPDSSAGVSR